MPSVTYHAAGSVDEATRLLAQLGDDAVVIAGGTALVLMLKQRLVQPAHLVGLRAIPELHGIRPMADGGLDLGSLTTHRDAELSGTVRQYCPALASTFGSVATVRIRNQGTVGGSLAHADPSQDPPPMMVALGGHVLAAGSKGTRALNLDEFFVGYFETALRSDEVITSVRLSPVPAGTRAAYVKFLPRSQDDYAAVSVAATVRLGPNETCEAIRVALGGAGAVPIRARAVEAALQGQPATRARISEAAALVRDEVEPINDFRGSAAYKREMARVWTERVLVSLLLHGGPGAFVSPGGDS